MFSLVPRSHEWYGVANKIGTLVVRSTSSNPWNSLPLSAVMLLKRPGCAAMSLRSLAFSAATFRR